MINLFRDIKDMDSSIMKIMKIGFRFSFVFGLIFTYILFLYTLNPVSHVTFEIGYLGIKCSLMFFVSFLVGAMASDKFKKGDF